MVSYYTHKAGQAENERQEGPLYRYACCTTAPEDKGCLSVQKQAAAQSGSLCRRPKLPRSSTLARQDICLSVGRSFRFRQARSRWTLCLSTISLIIPVPLPFPVRTAAMLAIEVPALNQRTYRDQSGKAVSFLVDI